MRKIIFALAITALAVSPALAKRKHHEPDPEDFGCKEPLSDRGDQRTSEAWAKSAADKAWMQSAKFKWGERWADIRNAKGVRYECVKTGATGILQRCEIVAMPCKPAPQANN